MNNLLSTKLSMNYIAQVNQYIIIVYLYKRNKNYLNLSTSSIKKIRISFMFQVERNPYNTYIYIKGKYFNILYQYLQYN